MTEKLYYADPFLQHFTATVIRCTQEKDYYAVVLDRTCFYPEGGGQPADHGTLGSAAVTDVQEKEGQLLHYTDRPLTPGDTVEGEIDWQRRFDHMQQHSGEHIVSGLICSTFHCDNVGFHMGSDLVTIDFNHELTLPDIKEIEEKANLYIAEDHPVEIAYPTPEALAELPYRSKKALNGMVRIVTFPGVDCCACCGTHVSSSAQVGLVKFLSAQKFRDGSRLTLLCGHRAISYFDLLLQQNSQISHLLSAKADGTAAAVARMKEEISILHQQLAQLEAESFARQADSLRGAGNVLLFREFLSPDSLRRLMTAVKDACGGRCAVFSGKDPAWQYAIGENGGDLRSLTKELNQCFQGRGGGKPDFVQGNLQNATQKQLEEFFSMH